ncbi:unnamed protein product [Linum trigynum]|uniref:Secreted protein n=1 Tax=Linum trigynum TaxID=586398 RepID=A0AAV2ERK6_9ROSI
MFSSRGIWTYVTVFNCASRALTRSMYWASVSSLASNISFSWLTVLAESERSVVTLKSSETDGNFVDSPCGHSYDYARANSMFAGGPFGVDLPRSVGLSLNVTPSAMKSARISALFAGLGAY